MESEAERSGAKSGFTPNMLICGILLKGDLLTYCDIDDCINQSCGAEEFKLVNLEKVEVQKVGANQKKQLVTVDRFLTHKGMIFKVPPALYTISADHNVTFKDQEISDFGQNQRYYQKNSP